MPACDACRTRKIRCDRESPCGSCKAAKFECTTQSRQPRAARKTDLAVRQNVPPIKPKTSGDANIPRARIEPSTASTPATEYILNRSQIPSDLSELPSISLVDTESVDIEGGSSLHAHSIAARDLLVQTLGSDSHVRDNPKMIAALTSLRQIVEADKVRSSQKKPKLTGLGGARHTIYELTLPPTDVVLEIIRKSKERTNYIFSPPLSFITRDQFTELCKTVFFRTEDYPTSTAIITHGVLEGLFQEFKWEERDLNVRQKYDDWARLCRTNLEISISNLDLLLPATMESAQALLMAASYCMGIAQASICKKIVTHGCIMVQSLGWHRSSSTKNDSELLQRQKLVIFWMLYTIDKNLSLRLGQASLIQDYDIDLPLPWVDPSAHLAPADRLTLWVKAARMMSLIYQNLYSPGALRQTDTARYEAVRQLLIQIEDIKPHNPAKGDLSLFYQDPAFTPASYSYDASDLVSRSDEIMYYALLCMIYRATPTSVNADYDPAVECIKHARTALDCHKKCTVELKKKTELWTMYLHWTILNTPFVPFTTIFSHVLTTHNRADLERLQDFAESMSDCPASQPAYKVSRLASIFVSVATVYVESRAQEARNMREEPQQDVTALSTQDYVNTNLHQQTAMTYSMPSWAPFNPFLDALGFAEDPSLSMDGVSSTNANLENWFSGNQHLMGLLEDDLSYLDAAAMDF